MLENKGYQVLTATTPAEAIAQVSTQTSAIDLLITDVIMPEMNGPELAKRLILASPQMKLLYMSGYTADLIAHHGVLDEDVNFIQKPFDIGILTSKVREILDSPQPKGTDAHSGAESDSF